MTIQDTDSAYREKPARLGMECRIPAATGTMPAIYTSRKCK